MAKKCKHSRFKQLKRKMKRRIRKFRRQHSKIGFVVLLATILAIGSASTFAWFTTTDSKDNEFKTDFTYQVELIEEFTTPEKLIPNQPVDKKVSAKNTGDIPAFARILLFPEIVKGDEIRPVDTSEVTIMYHFGDASKWVYGEDGYYYYLDKLMPSEETPLLIDKVTLKMNLSPEVKEKYEETDFNLVVKLESVDFRDNEYRFSWWNDRENQPNTPLLKDIDQVLQKKMR